MTKAIIICVCAVLGLTAGYIAAPIASSWYIESREPDMFGAFAFSLVDNFVFCSCGNQPPSEALESVTKDLSILRRWRERNPKSRILAQEIGLAEVELSRLEQNLGHEQRADEAMKRAQDELTAVGWKDVSAAHLIALTAQLNSEYKQADQKNKTVATTH
jgi:hypothetical protein